MCLSQSSVIPAFVKVPGSLASAFLARDPGYLIDSGMTSRWNPIPRISLFLPHELTATKSLDMGFFIYPHLIAGKLAYLARMEL